MQCGGMGYACMMGLRGCSIINLIKSLKTKHGTFIFTRFWLVCVAEQINRGSYMSAHVLLNLSNTLRKKNFWACSFLRSEFKNLVLQRSANVRFYLSYFEITFLV